MNMENEEQMNQMKKNIRKEQRKIKAKRNIPFTVRSIQNNWYHSDKIIGDDISYQFMKNSWNQNK